MYLEAKPPKLHEIVNISPQSQGGLVYLLHLIEDDTAGLIDSEQPDHSCQSGEKT